LRFPSPKRAGSTPVAIYADNVSPTVSILSLNQKVDCRKNATLTFWFGDPGVNDRRWRVWIEWGEGNTHELSPETQGA
jgi:hypothetical protein